jgi:hypothetical protein
MRSRLAVSLLILLLGAALLPPQIAAAGPGERDALAQVGPEEETEGQEGTQEDSGEGQGGAEAETGAGGETEEGEGETGPAWTFLMAKLSVALLVVLAGAIALFYYRLVVRRQRGEV